MREYLVCVDGVVKDGPADAGSVQRQTDRPVTGARDCRPTQQCAPVEG